MRGPDTYDNFDDEQMDEDRDRRANGEFGGLPGDYEPAGEVRLMCGCSAKWYPGHGVVAPGMRIESSAFLCPYKHSQGDYFVYGIGGAT